MKKLLLSSVFSVFASLLVVACSGTSASPGDSPTSGGGQVTGTVGGEAFTFRSGIAHKGKEGSIDLILSDTEGLCDSLTQQKFHAGETIVQAYNLVGTAPGTFAAKESDTKYASLKSTCASGQKINDHVDKAARATTSEITLTSVGATSVEGKISITFDDGSSVSGDFSVPVCGMADAEDATCY